MDKVYLLFPKKRGHISPLLYGVLAEHIGGVIYDGIYAGENSDVETVNGFRKFLIDKVKEAKISVIRWPGGCFAETYDWKDGIGPRENRPVRRNWWTPWDSRYESNEVGTDEFLNFCELCEAEPYIAANMTTTTPLSIRDWIDYCNSPAGLTTMAKLREENGRKEPYNVQFWGVGNETWGGGGNMTAERTANEFRRYATIMDNTSPDLKLIGCGANGPDYAWTRDFLRVYEGSERKMSALSFHYYCGTAGEATDFTDEEWYELLGKANQMQDLIDRHYAAALSYGFEKDAKLCIDEWGAWHKDGSGPSKGYNLFEQQCTMRDAVISALTLNTFNNNCEKIYMACVAQLVNNLHSMFLSQGKNCITTPTYHVFNMYKDHQNADLVETCVDCKDASEKLPGISVSASVKDGMLTVTAANLSATESTTLQLEAMGAVLGKDAEITLLTCPDLRACNTFEEPEKIVPITTTVSDFDGTVEIPKGSIVLVKVNCN